MGGSPPKKISTRLCTAELDISRSKLSSSPLSKHQKTIGGSLGSLFLCVKLLVFAYNGPLRWLARIMFFAVCLCLVSCSAESILFLHNDTPEAFDYRISAQFSDEKEKKTEQGTLDSQNVFGALNYFSAEAEQVEIEITQKGKSRTRVFKVADVPDSLRYGSSGGTWSHIKVSESGMEIYDGSGNWGADFQHRNLLMFPCCGFVAIVGAAGLLKYIEISGSGSIIR